MKLSVIRKNQLPLGKWVPHLFVFSFIILLALPAFSQSKKKKKSIFQTLQANKIAWVVIETDLDSLIKFRNRETYQKGTFSYLNLSDGKSYKYPIKIRPRGKFRRRICDFPMIKIDFPKKALKKNGLAKFDDYKIVTHCMNNIDQSYESVTREYLAYKLYNILSPKSYNVHFMYITYVDTKENHSPFEHVGFMIEDTAEMCDRTSSKSRKELAGLTKDSFNTEQHDFVALFQYMIGNTDWTAFPIARNARVVKFKEEERYGVVPFDFDFSGLVAAPYAIPTSNLQQKSIRQRIFQGISSSRKPLAPTIKHFRSKKRKILNYIKRFRMLSKESKKDILSFLKPFFKKLESDNFLAKQKFP